MTLKEARRLFRSLRHYEQLSSTMERNRSRLVELLREYDISELDGYEVRCEKGEIEYRKLNATPYRQAQPGPRPFRPNSTLS